MQQLLGYVRTQQAELEPSELKEMLRFLCAAFSMLQFARVAVQDAGEGPGLADTFSRLRDFRNNPVDEAARQYEELLEAVLKDEGEKDEQEKKSIKPN